MPTRSKRLGSDAWREAENYEEGDRLHTRANLFLGTIDWDELISIASRLRGGISCHIERPYSLGHFNMVRRIVFADDVSWAARLRLPELDAIVDDDELLKTDKLMRIEVATMNFLSTKTTIPVPEVFHHDFARDNVVGASYILMSYIHGNAATDLRISKGCAPGTFGTPEQDKAFRQQMANIQIQLAATHFDRIGSLYQDGEDYTIGPEPETGKGPWDTPSEYYADLVRHTIEVAERDAPPEVRESSSFRFPQHFETLMQCFGWKTNDTGPFGLANRDFGAHNLLVDDEFNIVGVIDFDGFMAAPIDVLAQFPTYAGLNKGAPGHVETRPAAIARITSDQPKLDDYHVMLMRIVARLDSEDKGGSIARLMVFWMPTDGASIVLGLKLFGSHQKSVNDEWMGFYDRLMRDRVCEKASFHPQKP